MTLTSVPCTRPGVQGPLILTGSPAWPVGPGGPSAPYGKASSFGEGGRGWEEEGPLGPSQGPQSQSRGQEPADKHV